MKKLLLVAVVQRSLVDSQGKAGSGVCRWLPFLRIQVTQETLLCRERY